MVGAEASAEVARAAVAQAAEALVVEGLAEGARAAVAREAVEMVAVALEGWKEDWAADGGHCSSQCNRNRALSTRRSRGMVVRPRMWRSCYQARRPRPCAARRLGLCTC